MQLLDDIKGKKKYQELKNKESKTRKSVRQRKVDRTVWERNDVGKWRLRNRKLRAS